MGATKDAQGRLRQDAQALLIGVSHSGKRLGRCANGYCHAEMQPELCRFATVLALLPEQMDDCRNSTAGIRHSGHDMHCL